MTQAIQEPEGSIETESSWTASSPTKGGLLAETGKGSSSRKTKNGVIARSGSDEAIQKPEVLIETESYWTASSPAKGRLLAETGKGDFAQNFNLFSCRPELCSGLSILSISRKIFGTCKPVRDPGSSPG